MISGLVLGCGGTNDDRAGGALAALPPRLGTSAAEGYGIYVRGRDRKSIRVRITQRDIEHAEREVCTSNQREVLSGAHVSCETGRSLQFILASPRTVATEGTTKSGKPIALRRYPLPLRGGYRGHLFAGIHNSNTTLWRLSTVDVRGKKRARIMPTDLRETCRMTFADDYVFWWE